MESFTCGKVSRFARDRYLERGIGIAPGIFRRIRGGYMMYAWASQIDMARAMGRG
jgi:hypothetical protein